MKRFKFLAAAALLAGMAIIGATPARADLVLTISDAGGTATATVNTSTHAITSSSGPGTFSTGFNAISGTSTLAYTGTIGGVFFDLSVASTSNTPGTPALAVLNVGSNTIENQSAVAQAFTISASSGGFTAPNSPPPLSFSATAGGTSTVGSITLGTFNATADGNVYPTIPFASSGNTSFSINPGPITILIPTADNPYTITSTLGATLSAGGMSTGLRGSVVVTAVPEPGTLAAALSGVGLVGLTALRRKRNSLA